LAYLPNLITLDFTASAYNARYMVILGGPTEGILKNIKEIVLEKYGHDYNRLLYPISHNFRETRTHLFVDDYNGSHDFLTNFVYLYHLTLHNKHNDNLDFFDILHICPNLIQL
jgi:hypothetical protein